MTCCRSTSKNGNASHQGGLRDDEILGNIFIYNFAGHETTGNVLSYSIHLLITHPEVQDWIGGEIRHYLDTHKSSSTWTYEELFPKLKRCLAIMVSLARSTFHSHLLFKNPQNHFPLEYEQLTHSA